MGKMAKGVGGVAVVGVIAALYFGTDGFGFGNGFGSGTGTTDAPAQENAATLSSVAEIPDRIIVGIKEDKVTINGIEVSDAKQLKELAEEYNSDSRTFILEEDTSILETYTWVQEVFDGLGITLQTETENTTTP